MTDVPSGTVTFLFTDIEGSTGLWQQDAAAMERAVRAHDSALKTIIESHGGYVFKTVGDSFCAAFSDPLQALNAAVEIQRFLREPRWNADQIELRVRIGIHTGTTDERDGDYFGPTVNRVARIEGAAHGGQTLLSLATMELIRDHLPHGVTLRDLGSHQLKDLFRPEQLFQVDAEGMGEDFPPLRTLDTARNNLRSQATAFVGREIELTEISRRIVDEGERLVTVLGPGGIGKTRLALQVAAELVDRFNDGVWFVDLSPVTSADMVASAIAHALGVGEESDRTIPETVTEFLRTRELLLVIDNFEQVIGAAPALATLLEAAPGVRILVTSREVLRIAGEREYVLAPLPVPNRDHQATSASLSQYAAVALFIQRARATRKDFVINDSNAPAIAELCVQLDGLPLAIELAAARIRLFSPDELLARLGDRLRILGGGARNLPKRQQTIRQAIEWSYDLLEPDEQRLFTRLGVFSGGCSADAVEAVCLDGLDLDLLDGLDALVGKSLLVSVHENGDVARFTMLEILREFAQAKLREAGEEAAIRRAHAGYVADRYEAISEEYDNPSCYEVAALDRTERDHENIRSALHWTFSNREVELGVRITVATSYFWFRRGYHREWWTWLRKSMDCLEALPQSLEAGVWNWLGRYQFVNQNIPEAVRCTASAEELYRISGHPEDASRARVTHLMYLALNGADPQAVRCQFETEFQNLTALQEEHLKVRAMFNLALAEDYWGNDQRCIELYTACLAYYRAHKMHVQECIAHYNLTCSYLKVERFPEAVFHTIQAARLAREHKVTLIDVAVAESLGKIAAAVGRYQTAATLFGISDSEIERRGLKMQPTEQPDFETACSATRARLGDALFEEYVRRGREMTPHLARAYEDEKFEELQRVAGEMQLE